MRNTLRHIALSSVLNIAAFGASASPRELIQPLDSTQITPLPDISGDILFEIPAAENGRLSKESDLGHFTWGADLGSAVDLTANDMTNIDINGYFGYKGPWTRLTGIGAGIISMIGNSSRCYPVYAIFRSSFTREPSLCFLDLRLGVSFNNILEYKSQTDFFGSIGIGITLAKGKKFSSHIVLAYTFMPLRSIKTIEQLPGAAGEIGGEVFEGDEPQPAPTTTTTITTHLPNLSFASIRIGCAF